MRKPSLKNMHEIFGKKNVHHAKAAFFALAAALVLPAWSQDPLEGFHPSAGAVQMDESSILRREGRFSGYTNFWHSLAWTQFQYGNIFQMATADVPLSILQAKLETAEELGLPGLVLEEGFLSRFLGASCRSLEDPSPQAFQQALDAGSEDILLWAAASSEIGASLLKRAPDASLPPLAFGHQLRGRDFRPLFAFTLEKDSRRIFAVVGGSAGDRARLKKLFSETADVLGRYDLHRGWFGAATLLHSVTCFPGHPLEVIAQGLEQGNDWFTFSGYMDFLLQSQLPEWLGKVGLDVVTDVGTGKATHSLGTIAYGARSWDGLKIQDMPTEEEWISFVKERGGYLFRPVFAPECDKFGYDGSIAIDGNKRQIDEEESPFILQTGFVREEASPFMVLFVPKGEAFTRDSLWKAILSRREVGVLPQGRMLGPRLFRNALQLLWLDRIFLESRFGDQISLSAKASEGRVTVSLRNNGGDPLPATLTLKTGPELDLVGEARRTLSLAPRSSSSQAFAFRVHGDAMGRANPILAEITWPGGRKRTLAVLDLPPAVSVHKLLYGQTPAVEFPFSIHNFMAEPRVAASIEVRREGGDRKPVFRKNLELTIPRGEWRSASVSLPLPPGAYEAAVTALGSQARSQIGVEAAAGKATLQAIDLNSDGILEYRMENGRVRATLLAIGARVIEYTVKAKDDNIFFKLWPEKEWATDKRPFRERGFYPYGGFEDFLGQASIETHKVYDAEVIKDGGSYVRVRMSADYYGNRLEKIFTLYGDSPLLEVRFALDFRNPELHMIGPQPILELGRRHGIEDVFIVPEKDGLKEFRMRPEEYFGRVLYPVEGWNAGRDTEEDIAFAGVFPVSEPEFLHMWMNHPSNGESNHYYAEFQPWIPIFQKTTRYLSYYLWAQPGDWKDAVAELRKRNLITRK